MDDLTLRRVFAIMRGHDSARMERDLWNLKISHVHKVSRKPECGKPQHVTEAAQETTEPDQAMAAKLLDTTEPDLTMAETFLDTMEPGPAATYEASANPPDEELGEENPPDGELRKSPQDEASASERPPDEASSRPQDEASPRSQVEAPKTSGRGAEDLRTRQ